MRKTLISCAVNSCIHQNRERHKRLQEFKKAAKKMIVRKPIKGFTDPNA